MSLPSCPAFVTQSDPRAVALAGRNIGWRSFCVPAWVCDLPRIRLRAWTFALCPGGVRDGGGDVVLAFPAVNRRRGRPPHAVMATSNSHDAYSPADCAVAAIGSMLCRRARKRSARASRGIHPPIFRCALTKSPRSPRVRRHLLSVNSGEPQPTFRGCELARRRFTERTR